MTPPSASMRSASVIGTAHSCSATALAPFIRARCSPCSAPPTAARAPCFASCSAPSRRWKEKSNDAAPPPSCPNPSTPPSTTPCSTSSSWPRPSGPHVRRTRRGRPQSRPGRARPSRHRSAGKSRFRTLSGGQKQLVLLSRALAADAAILLLDEPTAALDLRHQHQTLDLIRGLARDDGCAAVFTTHHPGHALATSDRSLLMLPTSRPDTGPAAETLTEPNLTALYGVLMRRLRFDHDGRPHDTRVPLTEARPL